MNMLPKISIEMNDLIVELDIRLFPVCYTPIRYCVVVAKFAIYSESYILHYQRDLIYLVHHHIFYRIKDYRRA